MLYVNPVELGLAGRVASTSGDEAKRQQALGELEHLFLYTLLQEMRKSVVVGAKDDRGQAQKLHEQMLDDALSGAMARSGQLGLAQQMEQQWQLGQAQAQPRGLSGPALAGD